MDHLTVEDEKKNKRIKTISRSIAKIYYPLLGVKFRRMPPNEWVYPALQIAADKDGITVAEYVRIAAEEKLIKDGYFNDMLHKP